MKTNAGRLGALALASPTATNSTPDSKSEDNELNDVGMSMRDLIRSIRARRGHIVPHPPSSRQHEDHSRPTGEVMIAGFGILFFAAA
jgi:hypothetical protein